MTERIRDTGDELILYDDQHTLLRVTVRTRLLGAAHGGVQVLAGGTLIAAGIIGQRLVVESGGACYASGYIRAVPKVAEGGLLDVTGALNPVRWPDNSTAPVHAGESAPRFRIVRSGPTPTLQGPIDTIS